MKYRYWLGISAAAIVGFALGAAAMESAASDAADKAHAKAERIVENAKAKREGMLGEVEQDRDELAAEVQDFEITRERLLRQVATLKKELGGLERAKATSSFEGDGVFLVGADIRPGTYRAAASPDCYYAVLRRLDGSLDAIISNNNVAGPVVLDVPSSAKGVEVSGCAEFTRVP